MTRHDVLQVAKKIEIDLTESDIQCIIEAYEEIGGGEDAVEDLIYMLPRTRELSQCLARIKFLKRIVGRVKI